MSYIIMGIDECGSEFRADDRNYDTEDEAYANLENARECYEEARSIWIEELKDKDYYMRQEMRSDYE